MVKHRQAAEQEPSISAGRSSSYRYGVHAHDTFTECQHFADTGQARAAQAHDAHVGSDVRIELGQRNASSVCQIGRLVAGIPGIYEVCRFAS